MEKYWVSKETSVFSNKSSETIKSKTFQTICHHKTFVKKTPAQNQKDLSKSQSQVSMSNSKQNVQNSNKENIVEHQQSTILFIILKTKDFHKIIFKEMVFNQMKKEFFSIF